MKSHLFGDRGDLFYNAFEEVDIDQLLFSDDLRAEAALEVADIADFDMDLVKHTRSVLQLPLHSKEANAWAIDYSEFQIVTRLKK